jgi:hypothetical protein
MGFLIYYLFSLVSRNHSLVMISYFLAFTVFVINEISSMVILLTELESRPGIISSSYNVWDAISLIPSYVTSFNEIIPIVSFGITWLGTCLLMYHYSRKIGKWKFWLLTGLPLVYFIGNIDFIKLSLYYYASSSSPYLLLLLHFVLGGTKQIGGLFFGLAFIMIAMKISSERLKYYLLICATGIMLLFCSNQISLVQLTLYPPVGLVTITLLSLSSFLILIGLHNLASSMAFDKTLLESARKIIKEKASTFLYDIGSAQWQREMDRTIPEIMESGSKQLEDTSVPTSLSEDEMRKYINEITEEIRNLNEQKGG